MSKPEAGIRKWRVGLPRPARYDGERESIDLQALFRMSSITDHGCVDTNRATFAVPAPGAAAEAPR